jgi:hypothetical protein
MFLLFVVFSLAANEEPGFGGEPASPTQKSASPPQEFSSSLDPPLAPLAPSLSPGNPIPQVSEPASALTPLERELQTAGIDASHYPLARERVVVARLAQELEHAESRGLAAARDIEARWLDARAQLACVETIALFRMHKCAARTGAGKRIAAYRMTPGGPVALSSTELLAQAQALDPPGCARIDLIDDDVIERVKRARFLKSSLPRRTFAFHELDQRRALEHELSQLRKVLAAEGLDQLLVEGDRGYRR